MHTATMFALVTFTIYIKGHAHRDEACFGNIHDLH